MKGKIKINKPTIGVDCDEVVAYLLKDWLKIYNRLYNDNVQPEQINTWELTPHVKCSQEDTYDLLTTKGLFANLEVVEDSQEVIKKLSEHYEIFFVTNAFVVPKSMKGKFKWLQKNFPFIPKENYIYTAKKYLLNLDYMIDDNPDYLKGFKGQGLLFDKPYNQDCHKYPRFSNWLEIEEYLMTINIRSEFVV